MATMDWWVWLIIVLVLVLLAVGLVFAVQARRRSGGVIASRGAGKRGGRGRG